MLANRVRMRFLETGAKPQDIADANCKVATDADFSGTTNGSFSYIGTATRLVIPHIIKGVPVTSYYEMFSGTTVTEVRSNNPNVTDMSFMFRGCNSTSLDLSSFNTPNVTSMYAMFDGCSGLTSLDLSSFDTSNVDNIGNMFYYCSGLTLLDLSSFNTTNIMNLMGMFDGCTSITTAYARTQADANKLNSVFYKPANINFTVKG